MRRQRRPRRRRQRGAPDRLGEQLTLEDAVHELAAEGCADDVTRRLWELASRRWLSIFPAVNPVTLRSGSTSMWESDRSPSIELLP